MENQELYKTRRQGLLTMAGILAVVVGLVFVYFGYFLLMDANTSISQEMSDAEHQAVRYLSIGGIYLMINGVYQVVAGFYGAVNSGVGDCAGKCKKYGWVLLDLSFLNVVVLMMITNVVGNRFNVVLLSIPITVAVLYVIGCILNQKLCDRMKKELETN